MTQTQRGQRARNASSAPSHRPQNTLEAVVPAGVEDVAHRELIERFGDRGAVQDVRRGAIRFDYRGPLAALLRLRTVASVYLVVQFDVPRPRALLGDEHFDTLLGEIRQVI